MSKYKHYKRKLRWKSTIRKHTMSHGLTPCPDCGGDIQHQTMPDYGSGGQRSVYRCQGCRREWPDNDQTAGELLPNTSCPKCGRRMYFRDGGSLGGMWPDGAWECESGDYSHMLHPSDLVPDTYQDPDAPGDFRLPENFS